MSSPIKKHDPSRRGRTGSLGARCVRWLGPLTVGLLLQAGVLGCDPASTLSTLQDDFVKGLGTGISNLAQYLVLSLFI